MKGSEQSTRAKRVADLVLTEQREVQEDFQRLCISSHDNELCNASVEGLRSCREKVYLTPHLVHLQPRLMFV